MIRIIGYMTFLAIGYAIAELKGLTYFSVVLCYYLFAKYFFIEKYVPRVMCFIELVKEKRDENFDNAMRRKENDSKASAFIKDNSPLLTNQLYYQKQFDKEKYHATVNSGSRFAFIAFPALLLTYFRYGKMIKALESKK